MTRQPMEYAVQWMYISSVGGWITRKVATPGRAITGASLINDLNAEIEARAVQRPKRRWYQFPGEWRHLDEGED